MLMGGLLSFMGMVAVLFFISKRASLAETMPISLGILSVGIALLVGGKFLSGKRGRYVVGETTIEFFSRPDETRPTWTDQLSSYEGVAARLVIHPGSRDDERQILLVHRLDESKHIPLHLWYEIPLSEFNEPELPKRLVEMSNATGLPLLPELPKLEIPDREIPLGPFRLYY